MVAFIIIMLIIINIITAALAFTFWQAWREGLEAIDAAYDLGHLDAMPEWDGEDQ